MSELLEEMDKFKADVCVCAARNWVTRERNCGGDLNVLSFVRKSLLN